MSFLGYLFILIIVKWSTDDKFSNQAPSLVTTMIDMFLHSGRANGVGVWHDLASQTKL